MTDTFSKFHPVHPVVLSNYWMGSVRPKVLIVSLSAVPIITMPGIGMKTINGLYMTREIIIDKVKEYESGKIA